MNEYNVYIKGPKKGQCKTITDKLVKFVTLCGYSEIASKSKYRTFTKDNTVNKIFIGTKGAFRQGRIASKSRSICGIVNHGIADKLIEGKRI